MKLHKIVVISVLSCLAFFLNATGAYAINLMIVNNNINDSAGPFRLISSSPSDWQTFENAPSAVSLTFSVPVQPDKSSIRVFNLMGDQLDVGELEVKDKSMSVTLPELTTGKYTIKWKAHCQCNDNSEINNSFHFTVR